MYIDWIEEYGYICLLARQHPEFWTDSHEIGRRPPFGKNIEWYCKSKPSIEYNSLFSQFSATARLGQVFLTVFPPQIGVLLSECEFKSLDLKRLTVYSSLKSFQLRCSGALKNYNNQSLSLIQNVVFWSFTFIYLICQHVIILCKQTTFISSLFL